jgi:hypothetical protein
MLIATASLIEITCPRDAPHGGRRSIAPEFN